ncbi:helicase SNF2 [Halolactibacillus alkaliphilus]|uniref:Helicase SNF2 n=1 Tax=Halolactibacillus alkaliphilus TaxID=442899 RepID=A0A511WWW1_9BACI|nr:DEAD/DEAH box helicase [Halolactibacillus alkaliphilus]GEN55614.1 helicase SNF2 [Halolactibacillus alkaliphilus]GGN63745.1 helicase SNF2 [Halolactibacillus alkaliphilus]SFO62513.1 Superfamily II DNA or RNA helicase, SNF2 family [Halolactibacillus alkaliphilus]
MRVITYDQIKEHFIPSFFKRGYDYYQKRAVYDLERNKQLNLWVAYVEGSNRDYEVEVHTEQPFSHHYCSCPAFSEYHSCKHIVAVMLEVAEKFTEKDLRSKQAVTSVDTQWSQAFINHLRAVGHQPTALPNVATTKTLLTVDYFINIQYRPHEGAYLMLDMKIGEARTYVVKSISELCSHIETTAPLPFTSKFTFDPIQHQFSLEDKEILSYLKSYITESSRFSDSRFDYTQRTIMLTPKAARELLPRLEKLRTTVNNSTYKQDHKLTLLDEKPPLEFSLSKEGEHYVLLFDNLDDYDLLEDYHYLVKGNKFYTLTLDQEEVLARTLAMLYQSRKNGFTFTKNHMLSFLSEGVPQLEKVGEVMLDDAIKSEIERHPLQARMYIDYEDERIQTTIEFQYGQTTYNPLKGVKVSNLMINDTKKEQSIAYVLDKAGFVEREGKLYLDDEIAQYEFFYHYMPLLEGRLEIFMTEQAKRLFIEERHVPSMTSDVDHDNHLLDITFDFSNISSEDISAVFKAMKEKKRYHRLPSGQFVPLESEAFQTIGAVVDRFDLTVSDVTENNVHIPLYHSLEVDDMMSKSNQAVYKQAFKRLLRDLKQPETREVALPEGIEATLRDYQVDGFQWFNTLARYGFGGVLADDMGLGKTLQAISYTLKLWKDNDRKFKAPVLVVAPASLIFNWEREFKKFAPELSVNVLYGTKEERQSIWKGVSPDVWITSYPMVRQEIATLKDQTYPLLLLDEAQAIKNNTTKIAKAIRSLKAGQRFALSGTPIENSLDELWSLFHVIMPGLFPAKKDFKKLEPEKIARMVRPFILRRVKQDVLKELPDRVDALQYSELTGDQKKVYLAYLSKIQEETAQQLKTEGFQQSRMKILAGLTRLRQICCHPGLFLDNYQGESGKLLQLLDLIETGLANNHRLLIFSQFSSMLKVMANKLTAEGYDFFYLDGQTKSEARVNMAERFNDGEKPIFLISLKAGGTGLNLTGADTVILYDLWWNPAVEEQAAGRAHRMGQKEVVHVHRLIAEGTIEEKIYQLQEKKRELIDTVIQPGEKTSQSLSEEDIKLLLNLS